MRRFFPRSMLWFLPVVIIPVGALLVLQIRFLRTLEQKSISAERNWQRGAIEAVSSDVDEQLRAAGRDALSLSHVQLLSVGTLGMHFRRHAVPAARTFFAVHFDGGSYTARFYDANGIEKKPALWSESEAVKMALVPWHVAHKWERIAQPLLQVDERDRRNRILLRPVLDDSMHVVGVAGVVLDEALGLRAVETMAVERFRTRYRKPAMSIRVSTDPRRGQPAGGFVLQPLGFVFTDWRLGIRNSCMSPEDIAAVQFRNNMMWTGGAFVVLLGAIGLAGLSVMRQVRLSQMKSEFVSNVSHELRTPLSSIRVFGEYMRLGRVTKPEKIQEYGGYIEAESRRLTQLINNILDFSRIESAEKQYHFCPTDVAELVEQTVHGFEMPMREKGVTISFRAEGARPPLLDVDRDALAQVVVNLLDNAVKYSGDQRSIDVTVRSTATEARIAVRDHGIGIPASERRKIFEKFYRVGSGLVHDVKGSGLGLSIVEHVVKAHGGSVEVESEPGEGSTFTIVLPVTAVAEPASKEQRDPERPLGLSGEGGHA